jgi:hypothetical protein
MRGYERLPERKILSIGEDSGCTGGLNLLCLREGKYFNRRADRHTGLFQNHRAQETIEDLGEKHSIVKIL